MSVVDPALLKSRQDTAAARAGINPILASARGASNAVTAMLASTLNNPLKPIRFGPNIVEATTGRTEEAVDSDATTQAQSIMMSKAELPQNKSKTPGPENKLGDVEIA